MAERLPLSLRGYRIVTKAMTPLVPVLLRRRLALGKEMPERLAERYGQSAVRRPAGALVWVHAASVGEMNAVIPLIGRIRAQSLNVLCTSGTVTSAKIARERLPAGVVHQFIPLDTPRFVRRFLDHWRPDLALFVESDIWPNLVLTHASAGRAPMLLLNGRLSERSYRLWRRLPRTIGALLSCFELCLAQSPAHAERLSDLGAPRVFTTGNLKLDVPQPAADEASLQELRRAINGRPVIAAASTHAGEEQLLVAAHRLLSQRVRQLLTVIVPRHPERGDEVAAAASTAGLAVAIRSRGGLPGPRTDVYVMDTLGELGLVYRLAPIVFMGGSLVPHGGQNPIEAVKLGAAVLHGPHVGNFREIYGALDAGGGAQQVTDAIDLAANMGAWLARPDDRQAVADAARRSVAPLAGALDRTLTALQPYLMKLHLDERDRHA